MREGQPKSSTNNPFETPPNRQDVVFNPDEYRNYFDEYHFQRFRQKVKEYINGINQPHEGEPDYTGPFGLGSEQAQGAVRLDSIEGLRAHYAGLNEREKAKAMDKLRMRSCLADSTVRATFSDEGSKSRQESGLNAVNNVADYVKAELTERYDKLAAVINERLNSSQLDDDVRGELERSVELVLEQAFSGRQEFPTDDLHEDAVEPWNRSQQALINRIDRLLTSYEDQRANLIEKLFNDAKASLFGSKVKSLNGGYQHGLMANAGYGPSQAMNGNGYVVPGHFVGAEQVPLDGAAWCKEFIDRAVDAALHEFGYDYSDAIRDRVKDPITDRRARRRRHQDGIRTITLPQQDMDHLRDLFQADADQA